MEKNKDSNKRYQRCFGIYLKCLFYSLPFSLICISSKVKIEHYFCKDHYSFVCLETKVLLVRAVKSSLTCASLPWTSETETACARVWVQNLVTSCLRVGKGSLFSISPSTFPQMPLFPPGDLQVLQEAPFNLNARPHRVTRRRRRQKCVCISCKGILSSFCPTLIKFLSIRIV